jgi:hypothetical protein
MAEEGVGCARPTGSVVGASPEAKTSKPSEHVEEETMVQVRHRPIIRASLSM